MSKTLIIGASGQIGKMTTELLLKNEQNVTALVRDKTKLSDLESPFLNIVDQDLEGDFSEAVKGCDQVIFAAGSGGSTGDDKTLLIDLWAAVKAVNYAKDNAKHFIMVSSIGADNPDAIESDLKPYLVAKHMADEYLTNSGLNYTIVRPGTLTDETASMEVTKQRPDDQDKAKISRENVANALLHIATNSFEKNRIFELFDGDTAIKSAVK
ncbi:MULTISPECIES: SDR family oxidoreductase [unclassified Pseudoalteromonas]|uniref:SDR family oxidoreductase n=1 Tax=unclassified Pseudoalteromonas TaxID=194690 RepID=UPI001108BFD8|nr:MULTISPECIES: SDR family oxidoreductase [unclassified Pseudoalteromonas]TMN85749.1 oxidoreductase [Pseudoalteromonas sp. S410]TMN93077.1 oxidoreductase [Pseudoalteromonas sp. S408]TMN99568.1 oxidoreductase [Pseudoalteromonas sp. S407]TMO00344.1 oxidoreductase [Pseudoalteromonas sp. S409]TMO12722.1 oxidoreductase [Pseudoalteromonas sp. S186]